MFPKILDEKVEECAGLTIKDLISIVHKLIVRTDAEDIHQHLCHCGGIKSQKGKTTTKQQQKHKMSL